jgi:hypothetical protein
MKSPTYITTSWDDGHPLDLRVAELLTKDIGQRAGTGRAAAGTHSPSLPSVSLRTETDAMHHL